MRKTVVYAGVANLLQFRGQNVQMRNVGELFEIFRAKSKMEGIGSKWTVYGG